MVQGERTAMKSAWAKSSRKRKAWDIFLLVGSTIGFMSVLTETIRGSSEYYSMPDKLLILTGAPIFVPLLAWFTFTTTYPVFVWKFARKINTSRFSKKIIGKNYDSYMLNFKEDWIERFGKW